MNQTWIFWLAKVGQPADTDSEVLCWSQGQAQRLSVGQALERVQGAWQLVVPVEVVTACAVHLPTTKARWLQQALAYAVEEQLAEDVERLHLALGAHLADGRQRVFAIDRLWLRERLALFQNNPPQGIYVDADLLPARGTQLLAWQGRWLLGGEGVARLALDAASWPVLAGRCREPVEVRAESGESWPDGVESGERLICVAQWMSEQSPSVNLAQGEFAPRAERADSRRWRPVAAALGLCVAVQAAFFWLEGVYLTRQAEHYAAASEALYRQLFPQDTRLVDIRAQFDQHLASGQAGSGALQELLGEVSLATQATPALRIEQLEYSAERADLALQVRSPDFTVLEQLRVQLEQGGQRVQMGSASRDAEGVSARLVVGG